MEAILSDLSGSALRKLALNEVKQFIHLLDNGTTEELENKKTYLSEIFARLSTKEQEELQHLISLVSKMATTTHPQQPAHSATVLPAFAPPDSTVTAGPTFVNCGAAVLKSA
jgi:hypothetical protein